jgi:hypothetical protein
VSPLILALITVKSGVILEVLSAVAGVFIAGAATLFAVFLVFDGLDFLVSSFFLEFFFSFQLTDSAKRLSNSATQPLPRFKPYSALSESPTTKIRTGGAFDLADSAGLLMAGVATM